MTLVELQEAMNQALRAHNMEAKVTISGLIAQIKKAAIDTGVRGEIPETLVNTELLKAKKQAEEAIDGALAANREDLLEKYRKQHALFPMIMKLVRSTCSILRMASSLKHIVRPTT